MLGESDGTGMFQGYRGHRQWQAASSLAAFELEACSRHMCSFMTMRSNRTISSQTHNMISSGRAVANIPSTPARAPTRKPLQTSIRTCVWFYLAYPSRSAVIGGARSLLTLGTFHVKLSLLYGANSSINDSHRLSLESPLTQPATVAQAISASIPALAASPHLRTAHHNQHRQRPMGGA